MHSTFGAARLTTCQKMAAYLLAQANFRPQISLCCSFLACCYLDGGIFFLLRKHGSRPVHSKQNIFRSG